MAQIRQTALSGAAPDVAARLTALAEETGVDEIAITTTAYDTEARKNSYTLLAHEFALNQARRAA
jgi:alkanesulfonate monooxygenase SsuD/methylene tetrahydromethanopterin reductase-like flavin-dependent oxidoreductase (luciferase family)